MATLQDLALRYLGEYGNEEEEEDELTPPVTTPPQNYRPAAMGPPPDEFERQIEAASSRIKGQEALATQERLAYESLGEANMPYVPQPGPIVSPTLARYGEQLGAVGRAVQTLPEIPGVVEDVAATVGSGIVSSVAGGATAASIMINDYLKWVLSGPTQYTGIPKDYFKGVFERADKVRNALTIEPRTRAGAEIVQGIGDVFSYVPKKISQVARSAGVDEDKALLIERVSEFVIGAALVPGLRLPGRLRRKVATFKASTKKGPGASAGPAADIMDDPNFAKAMSDLDDLKAKFGFGPKAKPGFTSVDDYFEAFTDALDRMRRTPKGTPEFDAIVKELDDLTKAYDAFTGRGPSRPTPLLPAGPQTPPPAGPTPPPPAAGPTPSPRGPTPIGPAPGGASGGAVAAIPTPSLLTPDELSITIRQLNTLSPDEINAAVNLPINELIRRHEIAMDELTSAQNAGYSITQISDAGLQDRVGLYFNLVQRALNRTGPSTSVGDTALDIPPPPAMVPVDIPRPPRTPPGSMGAEAEIPTKGNTITSLRGPAGDPLIKRTSTFRPTVAEAQEANKLPAIKARILNPRSMGEYLSDIRKLKFMVQDAGGTTSSALRKLGFTSTEIKQVLPRLRDTRTVPNRRPPEEPEEPSSPVTPTPSPIPPIGPAAADVTPVSPPVAPTTTAAPRPGATQADIDRVNKVYNNPLYNDVKKALQNDPTMTAAEVAADRGISLKTVLDLYDAAHTDIRFNITPATPTGALPDRPTPATSATPTPTTQTVVPNFHAVSGLRDLELVLDNRRFRGVATSPDAVDTPIKIAYSGRDVQGIYIDTTGFNTPQSAAEIESLMNTGQMSRSEGMRKLSTLSAKARVAGVPISEAHSIPPDMTGVGALRIAKDAGIPVYTKKGSEYVLVPPNVVAIETQSITEPTGISLDMAREYEAFNNQTPNELIELMENGLAMDVDVSSQLPVPLADQFKLWQAEKKRGMDTSHRRRVVDILNDLLTLFGGSDPNTLSMSIGGLALSPAQKAAAQRLFADMKKGGGTVKDMIMRAIAAGKLKPEHSDVIESYFTELDKPGIPPAMGPRNMRTVPGSDPVVVANVTAGRVHPPLYQTDVEMVQKAPQRYVSRFTNPVYGFERYGLLPILHRYREGDRHFRRSVRDVDREMTKLRKEYTPDEIENAVAYAYSLSPEGRILNNHNKRILRPLTAHEQRFLTVSQAVFKGALELENQVRSVTGREPIAPIADYWPFIRAFSLAERMGLKSSKLTPTASGVNAIYRQYATAPFPFAIERIGGKYKADYDGVSHLERYLKATYRDYYISPVTAKVTEMIEATMPNIVGGRGDWTMIENNPGLADFLSNWRDGVLGTSPTDVGRVVADPTSQRMLREATRVTTHNVAASVMVYNIASALRQLGGLNNSYHALGEQYLLQGVWDAMDPKRRAFSAQHSSILDTRALMDYDQIWSGALAKGSPLEIIKAMRDLGFGGHVFLDKIAAEITWHGAYRMGEAAGMSGRTLRHFADDIVVKTQGNTMPGDLVAFQQNVWGQMIGSLQTQPIAQANYIWHEIFNVGGKLTGRDRALGLARWLFIGIPLMWVIYEKGLSINSPLPSPAPDPDNPWLMYAYELAGLTPWLGGLQHGRGINIPAGQAIQDVTGVHGSSIRNVGKGVARLTGFPLSIYESVNNMMDPYAKDSPVYPFYRTIKDERGPRRAGAPGSARRPR